MPRFPLLPGCARRGPKARKVSPQARLSVETLEGRTLLSGSPSLTLVLAPHTVAENAGAGAATGTVTRNNTDNSQALTVNLTSSNTTQATVPASVTIPAGSASATFDVNAVDNHIVDPTQTVTITGSAAGGPSAQLDQSFGSGGFATVPLEVNSSANLPSVKVQPDGKILAVAGTTTSGVTWAVTRTLANGAPDTSFGSGGTVVTTFPGSTGGFANGIALQPDGKIIVVGTVTGLATSAYDAWGIARYNADGTPDTSFATGGLDLIKFTGEGGWLYDAAVLSNGAILVGGMRQDPKGFAVARLTSGGQIDTSFGTGGFAGVNPDPTHGWYNTTGQAMLVQPDGKILMTGDANFNYLPVARFNANGTVDTTFNGSGVELIPASAFGAYTSIQGNGLAIQADGKVLVVGTAYHASNVNSDFVLARLNTDGTLDTGFGGGVKALDFAGADDQGNAVMVQADGKIVVGGQALRLGIGFYLGLARYNADGTLDTSFNGNGELLSQPPGPFGKVWAIAPQPDGKLVALASAYTSTYVVRYDTGLLAASDTLSVTDTDTGPTANAGGPYSVAESGSVQLDASGTTDPSQDPATLTYAWDLNGNGVFGETGAAATNGDETGIRPTFFAAGITPRTWVVHVKATDSAGQSSIAEALIHITNVPPTLNLGGDTTASEGSLFTQVGSFSDPGPDAWTLTADYGDGSGAQPLTYNVNKGFTLSHVYDDNGAYTVTVTVADNYGGTDSKTLHVTVNNVAPTATLSNGGPFNEGSPVTVSFSSAHDPSMADTNAGFHYSFATDPTQLAGSYASAGTASSAPFTFDDNGAYTIYGRILDKDGGHTDYQTTVTVNNVAPTAILSNNGPVNEGSPVAVSFTNPFDPSAADTNAGFRYSFATDPATLAGSYASAGAASSIPFTFDDNGAYTVYGRIFDKDGGHTDYQTTVTVNNVAPTATLSNSGPVNEGSSVIASFTTPFDPSAADTSAGFRYSFATDPTQLASSYAASGTTTSAAFTFDDNGAYTVYGRILDKDNGATDYTTTVTVNNVAPTAVLSSNGPVNEGSPVAVSFTGAHDPSAADTSAGFHYSFATDPSQLVASYAGASAATSASFTFDDNGAYTVYGRILDKDGGYTDYQTVITVNNVAPTATLSNGGPVSEGSPVAVSFTNPSDPSGADTRAGFHYSFATDPTQLAAGYAAAGPSASVTFTFADSGTYTVYGRIFDKDSGYTDYQTSVTVNGIPPTAAVSGPSSSVRGQSQTFTFTARDVSPVEQAAGFTYTIDWGNGPTTPIAGAGSIQVDHVFTDSGTFTVKVWATDKAGLRSAQPGTLTVTVSAVALQGGNLIVGGTTGADTILLRPADTSGRITVTINGSTVGTYQPTGRIIVYAQAGDDTVALQSTRIHNRVTYVTVPAVIYGGDGNDFLDASGSSANNVLLGGAGDDTLQGGNGRDILIGGAGADMLFAGKGQDILIGGATDYDNNLAALAALLAEWGRTDLSMQARIAHLAGGAAGGLNGPYFLNAQTVHEDGSDDELFGKSRSNWFVD